MSESGEEASESKEESSIELDESKDQSEDQSEEASQEISEENSEEAASASIAEEPSKSQRRASYQEKLSVKRKKKGEAIQKKKEVSIEGTGSFSVFRLASPKTEEKPSINQINQEIDQMNFHLSSVFPSYSASQKVNEKKPDFLESQRTFCPKNPANSAQEKKQQGANPERRRSGFKTIENDSYYSFSLKKAKEERMNRRPKEEKTDYFLPENGNGIKNQRAFLESSSFLCFQQFFGIS